MLDKNALYNYKYYIDYLIYGFFKHFMKVLQIF